MTESGEPAPTSLGPGVGEGGRVGGVVGPDPLGEVPVALAAFARGDGDLTAGLHDLQHLHHVLAVGPPARAPRQIAGVGQGTGRQRSFPTQLVEDVLPRRGVGRQPGLWSFLPVLQRYGVPPRRHLRAIQGDVLDRAQSVRDLHQRTVADRLVEIALLEAARTEPRPEHQTGVGGDRRGEVHLQVGEVPDDLQQVCRAREVEELSADGDPSRLSSAELLHDLGHLRRTLSAAPDR